MIVYTEVPGQPSKEFTLYNNESLYDKYAQQTLKPIEQPQKSKASWQAQRDLLVFRLRTALSARGVRGLINLKRQFKLADTDGSNSLDYVEFLKAFNDLKIANVAESEVKMLFDLFDSNHDGAIQYPEFLD